MSSRNFLNSYWVYVFELIALFLGNMKFLVRNRKKNIWRVLNRIRFVYIACKNKIMSWTI